VKKIALVTGSNRGLGFETCRQLASRSGFHVILSARDSSRGEAARKKLAALGLEVDFEQLDVASEASIRACAERVLGKHGRLDVLVNNAGILVGSRDTGSNSAFDVPADALRKSFEVHVVGAYLLIQAFAPGMRERRYGRIVNLSSGMAQLSEMNGLWPAYRFSKTALNALTRVFADELGNSGVLVNSVCPGWVRTDMGGPGAELPVEEGADTIVWAATLPEGGPTGGFFRERAPISW
jgi:NAD(P)-dependent dehydrogenase (short-subunit alcohol dehydrogenase family)